MKGGKGTFRGETGLGGSYSVGSRFESAGGSNPEELLAAADAACFSMALAAALERNGTPATRIETKAACTIEKQGEGWKITSMKLTTRGQVPNVDPATFKQLASTMKDACPVSSALKGNVEISVDAELGTD